MLSSNNINVIYPTGGDSTPKYTWPATQPQPTPTPAPDPVTQGAITGINPEDVAKATYGKIIPLVVGGMPRIGGYIIYGPKFTTISSVPYVTFGVSMGLQANPDGEREIREIRFDGVRVWTLEDGASLAGLTFRSTQGTETQEPDALLVADYGDAAPAYRGQVCIFIENLDLTPFNGSVPFVSAVIADITDGADPTDGINLGTALETIANCPYVNIGADFEAVGVTARALAIIDAENTSFLELLRRFARLLPLDVVQTDKLRLIERSDVTPDIVLTEGRILAGEGLVKVDRQPEQGVAQELEFIYIDIDRDYEFTPQRARRPLAPIAVTSSRAKETVNLPIVTTASEAIAWVTLRKYWDEVARQQVSFTALPYGMEIEPGAMVALKLPLRTYVVRVSETLHDARGTVQCVGTPILRCSYLGFDDGPEIGDGDNSIAGTFVVGGADYGGADVAEVFVSANGGTTWVAETSDTSPSAGGHWFGSADRDGELFIIGGGTTSINPQLPLINTSPDGITWTSRSVPCSTEYNGNYIGGVTADGPLCVAVGYQGSDIGDTPSIWTSSDDGITWDQTFVDPSSNSGLDGVAYGGGVYVAVGEKVTPIVYTSSDGLSWTGQDMTAFTNKVTYSVAWNGSLFVAVGWDIGSSPFVLTSPDGVTWTQRTTPLDGTDITLNCVRYAAGLFVAVGYTSSGNFGIVMTSSNGTTWTDESSDFSGVEVGFQGLGYASGTWVAVGSSASGDNKIFTSTDASTWTERTPPVVGGDLWTVVGRG